MFERLAGLAEFAQVDGDVEAIGFQKRRQRAPFRLVDVAPALLRHGVKEVELDDVGDRRLQRGERGGGGGREKVDFRLGKAAASAVGSPASR